MAEAKRGGTVNIALVKKVAYTLPPDSPVRAAILGEEDVLDRDEFTAKAEVWVRLVYSEKRAISVAEISKPALPKLEKEIERLAEESAP